MIIEAFHLLCSYPYRIRCRSAITPRTKMIIVNTPHNPVGKVFTRAELEIIAALAKEHNLLVMSDEVVRTSTVVYFLDLHSICDFLPV